METRVFIFILSLCFVTAIDNEMNLRSEKDQAIKAAIELVEDEVERDRMQRKGVPTTPVKHRAREKRKAIQLLKREIQQAEDASRQMRTARSKETQQAEVTADETQPKASRKQVSKTTKENETPEQIETGSSLSYEQIGAICIIACVILTVMYGALKSN